MKKMSLVKRLRAFTLLEMLLVIAVVGILASLAIQQYQKTALNQKNDKVVSQFQAIMQAATNYQLDQNGKWPVNSSEGYSNSDFVKNYLPNQNYTSAYGEKFQWHHSQENNGQPSPLFTVMLNNVPKKAAEQIANRLPNAQTYTPKSSFSHPTDCSSDSRTCQVRAEIPSSGGINQPANIEGFCEYGKTEQGDVGVNTWTCTSTPGSNQFNVRFTKSPCISSEHTHLITALSNLQAMDEDAYKNQAIAASLKLQSILLEIPTDPTDPKDWTVNAKITYSAQRYDIKNTGTASVGFEKHGDYIKPIEMIPLLLEHDAPHFQFSFKTICTNH